MQKQTKRLFSLLLAVVMTVGLLPASAFAARVQEERAEAPSGEEAAPAGLAERPAEALDADEPAQLAAGDLTIEGYTRVETLGDDPDGYYLIVTQYNGSYYMLYPGATGTSGNNSARLVVDANGAATGYQVGNGTAYDSAATSTDFAAADNLVALRGDSNSRGPLYSATAVGPDSTAYYLCKKDTENAAGALYQTDCESAFTIHTSSNQGYFNLRHQVSTGSFVIFFTDNMNFNQNSSLTSKCLGDFMFFKSNTKEAPIPTGQLDNLITAAAALTGDPYTPRTWAALSAALTAARNVDRTSRSAVRSAISALSTAKDALQRKPVVEAPPAASTTYPRADGDPLAEGVYTILSQSGSRSVILYNSGANTNQNSRSESDGQAAPTNDEKELVLWQIAKTDNGYTIQGLSNNKYLTSSPVDPADAPSQRALSDSSETFTIVRTTDNNYQIKNSSDKYLSFAGDNHWDMVDTETAVRLYKQTITGPSILTADELRPAGGTSNVPDRPFPDGDGSVPYFYRIPALVRLENGAHQDRIVAMADSRWTRYQDALNIDTIISYSDDNGQTWHYSYPNFFGDTELTSHASRSAIFIDPVLAQDKDGNLYLMADACPAGVATDGASAQKPQDTTGFAEITHGGVTKKRMTIYTSPEASQQNDDNYSYYIGDFAAIGDSGTKYATIWDAFDQSDSGFYVDDHFYLYKKAGTDQVPADDIIYCRQLNSSNESTDVWVQQNVFFYNATLHVRDAQYLYLVKSTDGGETWGAPMILNDQVRTGEMRFYGPGPGAGICLEDGTIVLPCYESGRGERASFIYSSDGTTWHRAPTANVGSENTMVQIDNTTLRQFYRSGASTISYVDYTLTGGVWTPGSPVDTGARKLDTNQVSSLRPSTLIDGKSVILVSTATSHHNGGTYDRRYGKIHAFALNDDKTMTLLSTYEVNTEDDWYGYSSMAELADGSIGLLYEDNHTWNSYGDHCGIRYVSIPLHTILLPGLVARAEALNEGDYTADSWSGLATPLATAKAVQGGTAQDTSAETAYTNLSNAIQALAKKQVVITGTVTGTGNAAVEGAVVTLEDDTYSPVGLTATTGADGRFTFDNQNTADVTLSSAKSYKLKVQAPGYQVTTVTAAAFSGETPTSTTPVTLTAQPAGTYTNDFERGISTLIGAEGDRDDSILSVVEHNGSKALKISGLRGGDTPVHVLDTAAGKLRNGVVSMDITSLSATSNRFGLALRADGLGKRVWAGHFESNSTTWDYQSYPGGYGSFTAGGPLLKGQNVTRHVEVEMNGTALTLRVDGVQIGSVTNNNMINAKGYVGLSSTRSYGEFIVDNLYVRRTDPKSTVTLNTSADGALAAKVLVDGVEGALIDAGVYEGDTVVITGTGNTGKLLGGITVTDTTSNTAVSVTKTAIDGGAYKFSFEMPAHPVSVTGTFGTAVTDAVISGAMQVKKNLTATAKAGEADIPADSATYQWSHQNTDGSWQTCTDGQAQVKNVKTEDLGKKVKVRVEGKGEYAGWAEVETQETIGAADVELNGVSFSRPGVTVIMNGAPGDASSDNTTVVGNKVTLTAVLNPNNATVSGYTWSVVKENGDPWTDQDIVTLSSVAERPDQQLVTVNKTGKVWVKVGVNAGTLAENGSNTAIIPITVTKKLTGLTIQKDNADVGENHVVIYANTADELNGQAGKSNSVGLTVALEPADATGVVVNWEVTAKPAAAEAGGLRLDRSGTGVTVIVAGSGESVQGLSEKVGLYTLEAAQQGGSLSDAITVEVRRYVSRDVTLTIKEGEDHDAAPQFGQSLVANINGLVMSDAGKAAVTFEWYRLDAANGQLTGAPIATGTGVANNTYPLTKDDIGKYLAVRVTADTATTYYEGSRSVTRPQAAVKADGPAWSLTVTPVNCVATTNDDGQLTGLAPNTAYEVSRNDGSWETKTTDAGGKLTGLSNGSYKLRVPAVVDGGVETVAVGQPSGTYTIEAWDSNNKAISILAMTGGTVVATVDGTAVSSAAPGSTVTLTVTPDAANGYRYVADSLSVATAQLTAGSEENTWTFPMPDAAVTVTAEFEKIDLTIDHSGLVHLTCARSFEGGSGHSHTVKHGSTDSVIRLVAEDGYSLPASGDDITIMNTDENERVTGFTYAKETLTLGGKDREVVKITFTSGVLHNLSVTATGEPKTYVVKHNMSNGLASSNVSNATHGVAYETTLTTTDGAVELPDTITVSYTDGEALTVNEQYSYNKLNGTVTIYAQAVTAPLTIAATGKDKTFPLELVTVSGTSTVGQTLTVSAIVPNSANVSYQWERAASAQGSYTSIAGATNSNYTLTGDDLNQYVRATVTGISPYTGSVSSDPKGPVSEQIIEATAVAITAPDGNTVLFGNTLPLTAAVTPADATANTIKWTSLNPEIATVDAATGIVTAVAKGTATIRATVVAGDGSDGVTNTISITVSPAPIALRLTGAAVEGGTLTAVLTPDGAAVGDPVRLSWYRVGGDLATGEDLLLENDDQITYTLTAEDVGYRIKVTALVPSSTESNYTGSSEAVTTAEIIERGNEVPVTGVTLDKASATVRIGASITLHAMVVPSDATNQDLSWVSYHESVAVVDENGVVTGVSEGTAAILVFTEDGSYSAQCTVTVTEATSPSRPSGGSNTSSETTKTETRDDGSKVTTVTKPDGSKVETVEQPDGSKTEAVTAKDGSVTITATDPEGEELAKVDIPATIPEPEEKFDDLSATPWAEEAIHKMAGLELVNGTGGSKYDPIAPMTRGSLATVLHRLSQGKTDYENTFKDVAQGKYYTKGVAWAARAKVVTGYTADTFAPDDIITREQLAVMLSRYAKLIGMDTKADEKALDQFADGDSTGSWAIDGVAWCVENGILKGKGENDLDPTAKVTRAEVAVMLDRFIGLIK